MGCRAPVLVFLLLALIALGVAACSSGGGEAERPDDQAPAMVDAVSDPEVEASAQPDQSAEVDAGTNADDVREEPAAQADDPPAVEEPEPPNEDNGDPEEPPRDDDGELRPLDAFLSVRFPQHEGVATLEVWREGPGPTLVAAFTTGPAPFPTPHMFGLFEVDGPAVRELAVIELQEPIDVVYEETVVQVLRRDGDTILGPAWGNDIWFVLEGAVGAHGSAYEVMRWDGESLRTELAWSSPMPASGALADLDEDGLPEIVLNGTNPFVFCYACGVRELGSEIVRWDGSDLSFVGVAPPAGADPELTATVLRAAQLVEADLWAEAVSAVEEAERLAPEDEVVGWAATWVRMQAESRLGEMSAYPLLDRVFAGDYASAVEVVRAVDPFTLLDLYGPLTQGTAAEGWEQEMADQVLDYTDRALAARPELAPALFLRGLAQFWLTPDRPDGAITDINRALELAPEEPLYEAVAALLTP